MLNTNDYRIAPGGEGPLAYQWEDKPHRLVYDLCREVERLRAQRDRLHDALDEHGTGVSGDGTEYCVYCDWPFQKRYPDENGKPALHRPDCILLTGATDD